MLKKYKGLTIIELIFALAIFSMLIIVVLNVVRLSGQTLLFSKTEYDQQEAIRLTVDRVSKKVRESKAIFAVSDAELELSADDHNLDHAKMTELWDYFGLANDHKEIVEFIYDVDSKTHLKNVIAPAIKGYKYDLIFSHITEDKSRNGRSLNNEKILNFKIILYKESSNYPTDLNDYVKVIDTQCEAVNAFSISDNTPKDTVVRALATRSEITEGPYQLITFVLDNSASMELDVNGKAPSKSNEKSRLKLLIEAMIGKNGGAEEGMIDRISSNGNIYISVVNFTCNANYPETGYTAYDYPAIDASQYNQDIPIYDSMDSYELSALNERLDDLSSTVKKYSKTRSTNIGDGLRRAYFTHMRFKDYLRDRGVYNPKREIKQHMIILMDGQPYGFTWGGGNIGSKNYLLTDGFAPVDNHPLITFPKDGYYKNTNFGGFFKNWVYVGPTWKAFSQYKYSQLRGNLVEGVYDGKTLEYDLEYIKTISNFVRINDISTYTIGFSNVDEDKAYLADISDWLGSKNTSYDYADNQNLDSIFNKIYDEIFTDKWIIEGP